MCVECGTALNVSQGAGRRGRAAGSSAGRIAEGMTKDQIKDALVRGVRPQRPRLGRANKSFDNSAVYLVPIALALLAVLCVARGTAHRWRRAGRRGRSRGAAGAELDPDDARRLDAELAAFDR